MTRKILSTSWLLAIFLLLASAMPHSALAAPTASVSPTGDPYIDGILTSTKWANLSLSYSFPADASFYGTPYGSSEQLNNFKAFVAVQQDAVRTINLIFSEVTETLMTHGVLRYAESDSTGTAWGYYPSTSELGGDSWYNNSKHFFDNPVRGNYGYLTMVHETGHNLGLKHPHEQVGSFPIMPLDKDSLEYTVMSYRSYIGALTTYGYTNSSSSYPQTRMMYDIAALQYMYGADYTTNAGDTVYTWSPTTGQTYINGVSQWVTAGNKIFMTIWDGGGNDTYDFSNYTSTTSVDLTPGGWTQVLTTQRATLGSGHIAAGNIANALLYHSNPASLIENVIGGAATDTIMGNDADNTFTGKGGNDSLNGGAGNNTAAYSGAKASYLVTQNSDGSWNVSDQRTASPDGTDTLRNIQTLRFSDVSVPIGTSIPVNHAPVATNDFYGVDMNTALAVSVAAGVLANDSDQDGNPISAALVSTPLHGTVNLTSTGSFSYTPVTGYFGPDSFSYKANDGTLDSNVASVSINVQQVIPPDTTLPVTSITAPANGATVSGSISVTASASDNIGVTKVEFYKDGVLAATDTTASYSWLWDTTGDTNTSYTLQTKAYDAAGNVGNSTVITVSVFNAPVVDTTPPAVTITSPVNGTKLKGNGAANISVSASDASGIATIVIKTDATTAITCTNTTTCSYTWQGKNISTGSHTITALATDKAGNQKTVSSTVTK